MTRKRLLWYLYPSFLIITFLVLVVAAWYASSSYSDLYYSQVKNELETKARFLEYQILPMIKAGNFAESDSLCKSLGKISSTRISVILPSGEVIADSEEKPVLMKNHSDRPEFKAAMNEGIGNSVRFSDTLGKNMMYFAIGLKQDGEILAVVRTAMPITAIDESLNNFYRKIFLAGGIIAVCAAMISFGVSKKISGPIEQMTEVAKHFAAGDLDIRLSTPKAKELAELADALNQMAEQLKLRINTITEERGQIHAILSSMIEGVLAIDSSGNVVSVNNAAAKFLDIDVNKSYGRSIEEFVRNPQLQQFVRDTLEKESPTEADVFISNDEGLVLRLYGAAITDNKGSRSGAVLVMHDITRTRQLEEVRRDFVANVSHELKTPVTSIKGFVETLLDGAVNDPQQSRRFLEIIARQSDRLNAIIEDLLSLSRLEDDSEKRRLSFEETAIKSTLISAIEFAKVKADEKHIKIELLCDEKLSAKINSALIEQAVLNLVDNAVKYTTENGEIRVTAQQDDNEVLITVSDKGCGINREHLERIFERFYVVDKGRSRKMGGTGLGLSIVKHISQVHGGYATVESSPGQGSTFTIHLPATGSAS